MCDSKRTKAQLIEELQACRARLEKLKGAEAERKRAETALLESEKRFEDIAENTLVWIWEVDAEGRYTYASPVVR